MVMMRLPMGWGPPAPLSLILCTYMHNDAYYALSAHVVSRPAIEFGRVPRCLRRAGQDIRQVAIIHEVLHSLSGLPRSALRHPC